MQILRHNDDLAAAMAQVYRECSGVVIKFAGKWARAIANPRKLCSRYDAF